MLSEAQLLLLLPFFLLPLGSSPILVRHKYSSVIRFSSGATLASSIVNRYRDTDTPRIPILLLTVGPCQASVGRVGVWHCVLCICAE